MEGATAPLDANEEEVEHAILQVQLGYVLKEGSFFFVCLHPTAGYKSIERKKLYKIIQDPYL